MKQPKEGFYMGIRKMTEDGDMVGFENTYGPVRTIFIWSAYLLGGSLIVDEGIKLTKKAVKSIKSKIDEYNEYKKKKEESK